MEETKRTMMIEQIPNEQLSSEQTSFRSTNGNTTPLYKCVREPVYLNDLEWESHDNLVIWRDNNTILCIGEKAFVRFEAEEPHHHVCFEMYAGKRKLKCTIYGKTNDSVLETAVFFWSLKHAEDTKAHQVSSFYPMDNEGLEYTFDFSMFQSHQLAQMLDADPTRHFVFATAGWSVEQSVVLATRPYPLKLHFVQNSVSGFQFADEGTAFVHALEQRTSTFGSLWITFDTNDTPFSRVNLERLFQLEMPLEKLYVGRVDQESALLPLSANTKALVYKVHAAHMTSTNLHSLNIVAHELSLRIYLDQVENWYPVLIQLFHRMAQLGHFERLCLSVYHRDLGDGVTIDCYQVEQVAQALGRVIQGNPKLKHLELGEFVFLVESSTTLEILAKAMKAHKEIRTFVIGEYPPIDDDELSRPSRWLNQLLSRNRTITVLDQDGDRCSDGRSTENLYLQRDVASQSLEEETEASASVARGSTKKMRTSN